MIDNTALQEAIAYFEDAVRESDEIIEDCSPDLQRDSTEQKEHFVVALEAMRRAEPANEPLTLAELREVAQDLMAWCVVHECEKADCTAIIDYDNLGKYGEKGKIVAVTSAYGEPLKESDYGKTWLAYRRKPKEADHE